MNNENPDNKINPNWKPYLDNLPESVVPLIIPIFKEWDANVTKKFQEIHSQYDDLKPFKKFVDNGIDPEYAEQAVIFADRLQREPEKVVNQLNETWKLGFLSKEQAEALQQSNDDDLDVEFDNDSLNDFMKNPQFKEMYEGMKKLQDEWNSSKEQQTEEEALAEFEDYLEKLEAQTKEKNLPFNKMFVTALMQQGMDGEEAVNQYHQVLALDTTSTQDGQAPNSSSDDSPPIVMGSDGSTGSGTPDAAINFGSLKKGSMVDTVAELVRQAHESGQG